MLQLDFCRVSLDNDNDNEGDLCDTDDDEDLVDVNVDQEEDINGVGNACEVITQSADSICMPIRAANDNVAVICL